MGAGMLMPNMSTLSGLSLPGRALSGLMVARGPTPGPMMSGLPMPYMSSDIAVPQLSFSAPPTAGVCRGVYV